LVDYFYKKILFWRFSRQNTQKNFPRQNQKKKPIRDKNKSQLDGEG